MDYIQKERGADAGRSLHSVKALALPELSKRATPTPHAERKYIS